MGQCGRDTRWVAGEFDRRAATYDQSAMHQWQARQAAQLLDLQPGRSVLDVATGTGLAAAAVLALSGPTSRAVGIDVSAGMLQVAVQRVGGRASFLRADAQRLPFHADSFDAVICVAAIPYLPNLPAAVEQWRRVTRPGARLVFTTPAVDGVPASRLLREAAAHHGLEVPDPHAELGVASRIVAHAAKLGLAVDHLVQQAFPEPLGPDPQATFNTIIDYGFAEPLRAAPDNLRADVYASYRASHLTHAERGAGEHTVIFTRCRFLP